MQYFIELGEIERRAKRIGCTLGDLADDAGVVRSTLYRAVKVGADMRLRNRRRVTDALLVRERELLADLARLHPAEAERLVNGGPPPAGRDPRQIDIEDALLGAAPGNGAAR